MNIKEIVLKAGHSTVPAYWLSDEKPIACSASNLERLVSFAEALIAELAKQNEPVAFTNSAQLGYVTSGQHQDIPLAMWSRNTSYSGADIPLYTYPPTAEQIANETAWQPIETAPKDGRELILLLTPSNWPQVAYSNTWWQGGFSVENKPTHWMPLPTPPKRSMEGV